MLIVTNTIMLPHYNFGWENHHYYNMVSAVCCTSRWIAVSSIYNPFNKKVMKQFAVSLSHYFRSALLVEPP